MKIAIAKEYKMLLNTHEKIVPRQRGPELTSEGAHAPRALQGRLPRPQIPRLLFLPWGERRARKYERKIEKKR